jgi:HNH endonuclease
MPTIHCKQCGTTFHRPRSHIYGNMFCSWACRKAYHYQRRLVTTCLHCGAPITKTPFQAARSRTQKFFCNMACSSAHTRTGTITNQGYRAFSFNYETLFEHRLVMEQHLGRKLLPDEDVHHKDGNRLNNSPDNLEVLDHSAHTRRHRTLTWDLERALALRANGISFHAIENMLGVTHSAVRDAFIVRGWHIPEPNWRNHLTWDIEAAQALRAKGVSFREIGRRLGVSYQSVMAVFISRGLYTPASHDAGGGVLGVKKPARGGFLC